MFQKLSTSDLTIQVRTCKSPCECCWYYSQKSPCQNLICYN